MEHVYRFKVVRLIKRKPGMTLAEFKEYWLNEHIKLEDGIVREKGRVKKIVATFSTGRIRPPGATPPFDGMVELYFDRIDDFGKDDPSIMEALRKDEANFIDLSETPVNLTTEEYVLLDKTGKQSS